MQGFLTIVVHFEGTVLASAAKQQRGYINSQHDSKLKETMARFPLTSGISDNKVRSAETPRTRRLKLQPFLPTGDFLDQLQEVWQVDRSTEGMYPFHQGGR